MNMPLNRDGTVDFSGTLFGLIRTALHIKRPEGRQINVLNVGVRLPKTNLGQVQHFFVTHFCQHSFVLNSARLI